MLRLLVLIGLLLLPSGADVAAAQPLSTRALTLSRLLNPADKVILVGERAFDAALRSGVAQTAEDKAFFDENPGLMPAILAACQPVLRRHLTASMPALQNRFAAFYAERFNPAEIDALIDFYGSPTGSKLIEGMYAGADINALLQSIGEDGTDPVTAEEVGKFSRSTVERIMPAFTAADRQALLDFAETPVFGKLSRNLADFQRLMADVANEPSPALDAEIERVVKRTIEDYFARAKAADVS